MNKPRKQAFKQLISEMTTDELRELIAFCEADPQLNYRPIEEANKQLRKRNEIPTA